MGMIKSVTATKMQKLFKSILTNNTYINILRRVQHTDKHYIVDFTVAKVNTCKMLKSTDHTFILNNLKSQ